jgi:hypothetical protein
VSGAESELGSTDDARALVLGDPDALRATVAHLRALSRAFERTAAGLARTDVGSWSGEAADAFRSRFGDVAGRWSAAAGAFARAGSAWEAYARAVGWAQERAAEAAAVHRSGVVALAEWEAGAQVLDLGAADIERAREILADARGRRDAVGAEAARVIAAAAALAPDPPSGWERAGAEMSDLVDATVTDGAHHLGGIAEGAVALVEVARTLNPVDPANALRPARYLDAVSTTVAGVVTGVLHPVRVVDGYLGSGWGTDPAGAAGRALPGALAAIVAGGAGRPVVGGHGPARSVPLGFDGAEHFARFGGRLHEGLARAGFPGTRAAVQGSAATGRSYRTGEAFDVDRTSDHDVALGGQELFDAARSAGVELRSRGSRTGPLGAVELESLGLTEVRQELMEMMGRKVDFMIYRDIADAFARSLTIGVPGP